MRLIDADALMDVIGIAVECEDCSRNGVFGCGEDSAFVYACESITDAPTVDPVKHGRWIDTGEIFTDQFSLDEFPIYECSVCGSRIERKPTLDRFCNWCGARINEEDK